MQRLLRVVQPPREGLRRGVVLPGRAQPAAAQRQLGGAPEEALGQQRAAGTEALCEVEGRMSCTM